MTETPTVNAEDLALVERMFPISEWFGRSTAFLTAAKQLEARAAAMERIAGTMQQPTMAAEDAEIQRFIQSASATAKEIDAHWTITAAASQFHKMLVSYRERGVGKAERAKMRAQMLHNAYVAEEHRRVQEENARRQREAEAEASRRREEEAVALEARALETEAQSADLSQRERTYVHALVTGATSVEAARRAGYKDPLAACGRLASQAKIQRAIFAEKEAMAAAQQAQAIRQAPLQVEPVEQAAANVTKVGIDRTTWKAEIVDARAFVEAALAGTHGIPAECLEPCQRALTDYARRLGPLFNWPGVRAVKSTTTV